MTTDLIHQLVTAAAGTAPDRTALIELDGTAVSFAQFDSQISERASWITEHSRPGDRIAVLADNSADYARLYYAVPRSGRILTMINQRLSVAEHLDQLRRIRPALVVGDARYLEPLGAAGDTVAFGDARWQQRSSMRPDTAVRAYDPAWLLFTSGSTGVPKGVLHTHRSVTTAVRGTVAGRAVRPGGVYLLPFPMCHIAGYNMLVHHSVAATVLPVPAFRPESFVTAVNTHGVTSCSLAPTMLHSLLEYLSVAPVALPTLRDISYGSSAIPAALLRRAVERLGVGFHQGYGMTETGGNITFLGPADHLSADPQVLRSAGRPHDEVHLQIAPDGEILVRGNQVAAQYWPDGPVAVDGWLHTGDAGFIDAGGRLVVTDRLKDIIITGGENVSSREVEDVLSLHPGVAHAAVIGVPDEYWGEAICAVVVPEGGRRPDADELIGHVRTYLAGFKRPRHVLFVDDLPMTSNGKIAKTVLRETVRQLYAR
ncbi:AMP-binding protein [Mycobacterium sp. MBM]|nr:AMP-binding protein [Mycobacterium sp. MBM]